MADLSGLSPTQKIARGALNEQAREDWVNQPTGTVTTPAGTVLKTIGQVILDAQNMFGNEVTQQKDDYASLTAIAAEDRFDGLNVYVKSTGSMWTFDAASAAGANGGTVLAPDSGSGRWLLKFFGPPKASDFPLSGSGVDALIGVTGIADINQSVSNTDTAISLDFGQMLRFEPGADISSSGAGSLTNNGALLRYNYNPDGFSWTGSATQNYEALSVEVGPFGARSFGNIGLPHAISGAVYVPSTANIVAHGAGLAGHAKTESTTTGAVGVFGEADARADGVNVFGANFVANDRGYAAAGVFGIEIDVNQSNASSTVFGIYIAGGGTVTPATTAQAIRINPLGVGTTPKKRWTQAIAFTDGSADTALEIGSIEETVSGPQLIEAFRRDGGGSRLAHYTIGGDGTGNTFFRQEASGAIFDIELSDGAGGYNRNLRLYGGNVGVGYNGLPGHTLHVGGRICFAPGSSVTPGNDGEVVFELTNNTTLTVKAKGSDSTVRSGTVALS